MEDFSNFINCPVYVLIKDVATFCIAGITLWFAGSGLTTWKRQAKGLKAFDIAYDFNLAILELHDAISYVRKPMMWHFEIEDAIASAKDKYPNLNDEKIKQKSELYVYEKRWQKINDAWTKMESHLLGAEALGWSELRGMTSPIWGKIVDLKSSIESHFSDDPWMAREDTRKVIYDHSAMDKPDPFKSEIENHIKKIREYLDLKIK